MERETFEAYCASVEKRRWSILINSDRRVLEVTDPEGHVRELIPFDQCPKITYVQAGCPAILLGPR